MLFGKFVTAALLALMTISVVAGIATATEIETVASTDISGLQPMARGQAAPTGFDVLSPAALLFAGAVGAIFWLGRQRGEDNSNWE